MDRPLSTANEIPRTFSTTDATLFKSSNERIFTTREITPEEMSHYKRILSLTRIEQEPKVTPETTPKAIVPVNSLNTDITDSQSPRRLNADIPAPSSYTEASERLHKIVTRSVASSGSGDGIERRVPDFDSNNNVHHVNPKGEIPLESIGEDNDNPAPEGAPKVVVKDDAKSGVWVSRLPLSSEESFKAGK